MKRPSTLQIPISKSRKPFEMTTFRGKLFPKSNIRKKSRVIDKKASNLKLPELIVSKNQFLPFKLVKKIDVSSKNPPLIRINASQTFYNKTKIPSKKLTDTLNRNQISSIQTGWHNTHYKSTLFKNKEKEKSKPNVQINLIERIRDRRQLPISQVPLEGESGSLSLELTKRLNVSNQYYQYFLKFFAEHKSQRRVLEALKEMRCEFDGSRPPNILKLYNFKKKIGLGSFATVFMCEQVLTGSTVAIKIISKELIKKIGCFRLNNEIKILQMLRGNPYIIQLLEVYENDELVFLVFDYSAKGDLRNYLLENPHLNQEQKRGVVKQILFGLNDLHGKNVCHYDIKPDNILIDESNRVRISDFGISMILSEKNESKGIGGTPLFAAPEILIQSGFRSTKSDVWSFGVLIYWIYYGDVPFRFSDLKLCKKETPTWKFEFPKNRETTPLLEDLIRKMLEIDPIKRISIPEVMDHSFFNGVALLNPEPAPEKLKAQLAGNAFINFISSLNLDSKYYRLSPDIEKSSHFKACVAMLLKSLK